MCSQFKLKRSGFTLLTDDKDINLKTLATKLESALSGKKPRSLSDQKQNLNFVRTKGGFILKRPNEKPLIVCLGVQPDEASMTRFMAAVSHYAANHDGAPTQCKTAQPAHPPRPAR